MPMQALQPISITQKPSLEPREQGKQPLDQSCLKATNWFIPFIVFTFFFQNTTDKKRDS
jgi:hypothetical protein